MWLTLKHKTMLYKGAVNDIRLRETKRARRVVYQLPSSLNVSNNFGYLPHVESRSTYRTLIRDLIGFSPKRVYKMNIPAIVEGQCDFCGIIS